MIKVSKLVIIDNGGKYLLLTREGHPRFGADADLPGGTVEEGETNQEAMIREVQEETGVVIAKSQAKELYSSNKYSASGLLFTVFIAKLSMRPTVQLSAEHSAYNWLSKEDFLKAAKHAQDSYMRMVYDSLKDFQI